MCQKVNKQTHNSLRNLKGDICLGTDKKLFFIVDPHHVHTFPTVVTGVRYQNFQDFGNYLRSLGAVEKDSAHSRCEIEVLKGLWDEFREYAFVIELSSILIDEQISLLQN